MKDRAKTKCGLCDFNLHQKAHSDHSGICLVWAGFCLCAWNQSSPGRHKAEGRRLPLLFSPGANTHGVQHQSELSWFHQLPLLDLPLETLLSSACWQTLSYQEQECFSGQNREADFHSPQVHSTQELCQTCNSRRAQGNAVQSPGNSV